MTAIQTLASLDAKRALRLLDEADRVFFQTAGTRDFASEANRAAFRRRWFGRYADLAPDAFLFYLDERGAVRGYLAGCFDSFAPEMREIADDLFYYTPEVRAAVGGYPAHFHVNVEDGYRGQGVGRGLISRFADLCRSRNVKGMHVVTGAASAAVAFYERCGFRQAASRGELAANLSLLLRTVDAR